MHIVIDQIHRRLHLHTAHLRPAARPGAELAWWTRVDAWEARSFIDRHFLDPARMHLLRHALSLDGIDFDLARRSDDEVRQAGARRLALGAWRIASESAATPQLAPSAAVPAQAASPLLRGAGSAGARTSSRLPPPASRAPAPMAAAPAPAAAPDWPDGAAQVAQAQTLVQAARDGTPFCEICEARRRALETAAA